MTRSHLRVQTISQALAVARGMGIDVRKLLARVGLPPKVELENESLIDIGQVQRLWAELAGEANDELFGLHLGALIDKGTYGLVEYLCRTAATVGDALQCVARFAPMLDDVAEVSFRPHGSGYLYEHRIPGEPEALGRHGNECYLAMMLHSAQQVVDRPIALESVAFAHADGPRQRLAEAFRAPVQLGQECNRFVVPEQTVRLKISSADPVLHRLLLNRAEELARSFSQSNRFLGRARQAVRDVLKSSPPTIEAVAALLRCPPRWLQRRLAAERTGFAELVDSVRAERARAMATQESATVAQIAFELQYSDPSVFIRAFKRWTGLTPVQFRQQQRGQ